MSRQDPCQPMENLGQRRENNGLSSEQMKPHTRAQAWPDSSDRKSAPVPPQRSVCRAQSSLPLTAALCCGVDKRHMRTDLNQKPARRFWAHGQLPACERQAPLSLCPLVQAIWKIPWKCTWEWWDRGGGGGVLEEG
jgi:hypothetical protein